MLDVYEEQTKEFLFCLADVFGLIYEVVFQLADELLANH